MENKIRLELKNVSFSYGKNTAVKNFSLQVEDGSFTSLLGPSGCGKTTLLRIISGFLEPKEGEIFIDGKNQKGIEPNRRRIGMVFQDYALFPHLNVRQNLLYGLKINHKSKQESEEIISKIAKSLEIENLLARFPNELSGGQQQRVALGRALVLEPAILLMDEPLSSLDTKLRTYVREELREIQEKLKITTIYVTHDQEEALSLSDKIAVLNEGNLLQVGTPKEIYFAPKDKFTADFVGRANLIEENDEIFMIRPEWFELAENSPASNQTDCLTGKIISKTFLGEKTRLKLLTNDGKTILADLRTITLPENISTAEVTLRLLRKTKLS
ncbi:ABC transporter ATP-binding protein [Treponema zioleckii]|uniref:ABC transporter ATP-binding protein n=1 Tax=Treponema zioleckii TaxID=331680 RepID=UPI00168AB74B|nr:ABC transporter ATP-binding protein [Treponema zioleckii]